MSVCRSMDRRRPIGLADPSQMPFATNVFVNCPFDAAYRPLLRAILFAVIDLGMTPRIASERLDSGETRISKIMAMIRESRFGIHDLSRLKSSGEGEFFRLNMPFELGLDIGCRAYGSGNLTTKRCLILETDPYRYQAAISDLSNSDIEPHGDDPALGCERRIEALAAFDEVSDHCGVASVANQVNHRVARPSLSMLRIVPLPMRSLLRASFTVSNVRPMIVIGFLLWPPRPLPVTMRGAPLWPVGFT